MMHSKGELQSFIDGLLTEVLCVRFLSLTKYIRKSTFRRKVLFLLTVSEVSIHDHCCFEPVERQNIMAEHMYRKAVHLMAARKHGETERS
jgi:hypothetical protein